MFCKCSKFIIIDKSLQIFDLYYCSIAHCRKFRISVFLPFVVRSSFLVITQNGNGVSEVTVTEAEISEIVCTAVGARPAVTIDWYHKTPSGSETKITDGVTQVDTPNGDTFDSVSTLQYTVSKDYNGGTLRCVTTGQEVAESREDTATLNVQCKWWWCNCWY